MEKKKKKEKEKKKKEKRKKKKEKRKKRGKITESFSIKILTDFCYQICYQN